MVQGGEGSLSEWNEGDLKSLRLHQAQNLINNAKINPLGYALEEYSSFGCMWNYELWIAGIDILFGEGLSKYSETASKDEIGEIDRIKKLLLDYKKAFPIFGQRKIASLGEDKIDFVLIPKNWENLKKIIELFEKRVKQLNDLHGLSTKNQKFGGGL